MRGTLRCLNYKACGIHQARQAVVNQTYGEWVQHTSWFLGKEQTIPHTFSQF